MFIVTLMLAIVATRAYVTLMHNGDYSFSSMFKETVSKPIMTGLSGVQNAIISQSPASQTITTQQPAAVIQTTTSRAIPQTTTCVMPQQTPQCVMPTITTNNTTRRTG